MIGQFQYSDRPCGQHVVVWMEWLDGLPSARVEAPGHVSTRLQEMDMHQVVGTMGLEFALGYGVIIAALAGVKLTLAGDLSAWPAEWGRLSQPNVLRADRQQDPVH